MVRAQGTQLKRWTQRLVALIGFLLYPAAAYGADSWNDALDAYNRHEYARAAKFFVGYCQKVPSDATAHYYLANCYLGLRKNLDAEAEYRTCSDLSPDSTVGKFSSRALASLHSVGVIMDNSKLNQGVSVVPSGSEWYKRPKPARGEYRSKWDKWDEDYVRQELNRQYSPADSTIMVPLGTSSFVRNYQPISRLFDRLPPVTPILAKEAVRPGAETAPVHGGACGTAQVVRRLSGKLMPADMRSNSQAK